MAVMMWSLRRLWLRSRVTSAGSFVMATGSGPESWLPERSSVVSVAAAGHTVGMAPVMEALAIVSSVKLVSLLVTTSREDAFTYVSWMWTVLRLVRRPIHQPSITGAPVTVSDSRVAAIRSVGAGRGAFKAQFMKLRSVRKGESAARLASVTVAVAGQSCALRETRC